MAHFAKVTEGIVEQVIVIDDSVEERGQDFINNELKLEGTWIQTSYNTRAGQHANGGTPLRFNYAGIGYSYDADRDAFIPPKPFDSWILNEETCTWEAPIPYPEDGLMYVWNEELGDWEAQVFDNNELA